MYSLNTKKPSVIAIIPTSNKQADYEYKVLWQSSEVTSQVIE